MRDLHKDVAVMIASLCDRVSIKSGFLEMGSFRQEFSVGWLLVKVWLFGQELGL